MGDCNRCREVIGATESIRCDGVCGKTYHITCAGPGKGITKTFYNAFVENDYFLFLCTSCRVSSMKTVRESLEKLLNMVVICDERLNRQNNELVKLNENNEELKLLVGNKDTDIKELRSEVQNMKANMSDNSKIVDEGIKELKSEESINTEKIIKVIDEVKYAIKHNEDEIKQELQKTKTMSGNKLKPSFADKLKSMVNEPMVIVTPKIGKDNKKTKEDLKSMIDPTSLQINHSRNLSNGGIAMSCSSSTASKKLQELAIEKMSGEYDVKITEMRRPKIKIVGMSDELSDDEIIRKLKAQNEFLSHSELKVVHKYVGLRGFHSAVLEVNGEVCSKLLEAGRVFIDFDSCRVVEDIQVMRCFKCCQFYHKGRDCKNKMACQMCGEEHETANCDNRIKNCVNCKLAVDTYKVVLDTNHASSDKNCPMFKRKLAIARRRVSYHK